jgi:hypothetical protein
MRKVKAVATWFPRVEMIACILLGVYLLLFGWFGG